MDGKPGIIVKLQISAFDNIVNDKIPIWLNDWDPSTHTSIQAACSLNTRDTNSFLDIISPSNFTIFKYNSENTQLVCSEQIDPYVILDYTVNNYQIEFVPLLTVKYATGVEFELAIVKSSNSAYSDEYIEMFIPVEDLGARNFSFTLLPKNMEDGLITYNNAQLSNTSQKLTF